ncbi:MAG: chloride channel protein [Actinobacteria bacterium]|nr:chloride channel protein [Actinomycetota bacterium]
MGPDERDPQSAERELGDFTTTWATVRLVPLAAIVGVLSAFVALLLLKLIAFVTNLAYFQRWSTDLTTPAGNNLGIVAVVVPVVGGLIVGLMARFGSERIRGHGIPEAMETILVGGSKAQPRVTLLKPLSSAVSIGTGGPFGAEGPIVLTGGALGSVLAQFFHLSAIERRSLLVAGAAGGMSAVFGTPVAAVLLGVELLVFEWKPRSMVLIGISSAMAAAVRNGFNAAGWLEHLPLFPTSAVVDPGLSTLFGALVIGVMGGGAAWVLTKAVYGAEDLFNKLSIHWVWWPALGGLAIGIGGLIEPRALGVGYSVIAGEIAGKIPIGGLLAILIVKLVIWAIALGSGTSGGILAPILIMGAAVGGLMAPVLPGGSAGAWALLGMGATLAGVTRSPLTAIIFAFELTYDTNMLLPLLLAATVAHLVSVLTLKRSILTEKVARRGFHVLREYAIDALDVLFVRDVMSTGNLTIARDHSIASVYSVLESNSGMRHQRLLPVVEEGRLVGVVPWADVLERAARAEMDGRVDEIMTKDVVVTYPDESLRVVADRMSQTEVGVVPVVDRGAPQQLLGLVTQFDLLSARERVLQEERHRERVLKPRFLPGARRRNSVSDRENPMPEL